MSRTVGCVSRTMPGMCSSPPGRARWRIKTDGLFRAGQGPPFDNPAAARRRRGLRARATQPTRVHHSAARSSACRWRRSGRDRGVRRHHHAAPARPRRRRQRAAPGRRRSWPGQDRRHDPGRLPAAGRPARPGRDDRPGELRHHRADIRVPVHAGPERDRHRARPRRELDPERRQHASGRSSSARASSGRTGRTSLGRRGRDDGSPGRRRQLGHQGRPRQGLRGRDRPDHRDHEPGQRQRQLPVPRLGLQRPVADHAGGLRPGHVADKTPNGTGAWKIVEGSYDIASGVKFVRNDAWWGGKTPLDGTEFTFFDDTASMVTAYQGGQIDALVQFDVLSGAPLFNDANFTVVDTPTTNHRQIWMHTDSGTFADPKVRQAFALSLDRPALIQQLFKGKGVAGQRPRDLAVLPVLQRYRCPADAGHRRRRSSSWPMPGRPPSVPPSSTDA